MGLDEKFEGKNTKWERGGSETRPRNATLKGMVKKGSYEEARRAGEVREKPGQGFLLKTERECFKQFLYKNGAMKVWKFNWGMKKTRAPPPNPNGVGEMNNFYLRVVASSRENHVLTQGKVVHIQKSLRRERLFFCHFPEDLAVRWKKMPREAQRCADRAVARLEWPRPCLLPPQCSLHTSKRKAPSLCVITIPRHIHRPGRATASLQLWVCKTQGLFLYYYLYEGWQFEHL